MKRIEKSKLFPYTISEDIANSISHGIAALIVSILNVFLIYKASQTQNAVVVATAAIYGYSSFLMFLMSCLYHGIWHYETRDIFKRLDHSFIFIQILATYTPIVFVGLHSKLAYITFIILCLVTIAGIVFKVFFVGKFKRLSTLIFVAMGWAGLILVPQMATELAPEFIKWLIIGGVFYTVGAILYAVGKFKYHHFIWHIFVIAGVFAHYYAIYQYLV
ncbi:PAQR family membrane homeostasis protein TrhA [Mycoplasma sp. P36-A1]|uniref:PAQR family membrane homeostasis protein TrhA n=1 Tax=Mycoplasma sp. P36-A1 TaxID=3252900 RepID=UPI003C2F60BD